MHDIDGFVYGNQPGLIMCVGDRVSWHIMSGILMHSPLFYGNTVTFNGQRKDALGQIQGVENTVNPRGMGGGGGLFKGGRLFNFSNSRPYMIIFLIHYLHINTN